MHHVIVVEHDHLLAADFVGILEEAGHQIVGLARRPDEAIELATTAHADIALIDVDCIGAADGLFVAQIFADRFHVSAVFIGAAMSWEFMQDCRYFGPTGFIVKPYTASAITGVFAREATSSICPAKELAQAAVDMRRYGEGRDRQV